MAGQTGTLSMAVPRSMQCIEIPVEESYHGTKSYLFARDIYDCTMRLSLMHKRRFIRPRSLHHISCS
jgi:hypothetical protein